MYAIETNGEEMAERFNTEAEARDAMFDFISADMKNQSYRDVYEFDFVHNLRLVRVQGN